MDPQEFIAMQMQRPGGMETFRPKSDLMRLLEALTARYAKGAAGDEGIEDRIFGSYGYDPDIPEKEGFAPPLPPVGGGRHQVSPPMKSYGTDDDLKIYDLKMYSDPRHRQGSLPLDKDVEAGVR